MMSSKTHKGSVVDKVCRSILTRVLDSTYGSYARLPAERELASELNVSRVCVREALRKLVEWRVVATRPGSGAMVLPRRFWTLGIAPFAFAHELITSNWENLFNISSDGLWVRRFLMTELVRRAAPRIPPKKLDSARKAVLEAWDRRNDVNGFMTKEVEVIPLILEAASLYSSLWTYNGLAESYQAIMVMVVRRVKIPEIYVSAHMALMEALEAGDGESAAAHMHSYLDALDESIMAVVPDDLRAQFADRSQSPSS